MAAKLALVFVAAFVLFQISSFQTDATVVRRDAPTSASTEKNELEDALNSIKQGLEEFVNKVQTSDVYQNASKILDEFGQKVKQQGEELVQKIKSGNTAST